jgi:hypothetical protein
MNKKLNLFLLSAFALFVGLFLGSQLVERAASAQRTNPAPREGEWEYCAAQITVVYATENSKTVGVGQICYFKSSGAKCERVDTMVDGTLSNSFGVAKADTWAKVISKLGDDGWQLVAEGPWLVTQSEDKSLYFRRPKLN